MGKNITMGVDLGWASQLESQGVRWVDDKGEAIDPVIAAREMGADAVRLRVFVNPPKEAFWQKREGETCMLGFADVKNVLSMSRRVKAAGMKLMIDFHYSDHFADPQLQDIPEEWKGEDVDGLCERVAQHTRQMLTLLTDNEIYPDWVQVGNEINPGILLPIGSVKDSPKDLVKLLNTGYDTVKACCPDTQVITHVACVHSKQMCDSFFTIFFENGGKTDIMGFSYYPYWYRMFENKVSCDIFYNPLIYYSEKYGKPVMVCEVGGPEYEEQKTYELLFNTIEALRQVPNEQGLGLFYWEPEVGAALLPDKYPLGAARLVGEKTLQYTKVLTAYRDSQCTSIPAASGGTNNP